MFVEMTFVVCLFFFFFDYVLWETGFGGTEFFP